MFLDSPGLEDSAVFIRGELPLESGFLLEATLSQTRLLIGPGLITWVLGCTFVTQLPA